MDIDFLWFLISKKVLKVYIMWKGIKNGVGIHGFFSLISIRCSALSFLSHYIIEISDIWVTSWWHRFTHLWRYSFSFIFSEKNHCSNLRVVPFDSKLNFTLETFFFKSLIAIFACNYRYEWPQGVGFTHLWRLVNWSKHSIIQ